MRFHHSFLTLALIALFALVAGPIYVNAQNRDSAEISRLLAQAREHAVQLDDDATELESYASSDLSWETHAEQLERMRAEVNSLGKLLRQMQDVQTQGSPWQQDAIDRIDPLLRQMAHQLTLTIDHGSRDPNQIHLMQYKDYTHACADYASRTARLISDIVAYDKAHAKAKKLEQMIELPASATPKSK